MEEVLVALDMALEQVDQLRKSAANQGQAYRLDRLRQEIQTAGDRVRALVTRLKKGDGSPPPEDAHTFLMMVIWDRPRKQQKYEAFLTPDGKIRLADGRGPFTPSGACKELAGGQFDGWREWRYWDEDGQKWLPIDEGRKAGWFA